MTDLRVFFAALLRLAVFALFVLTMSWSVVCFAASSTANEPALNLCNDFYNRIPAAAKQYAISGTVLKGFKPRHARVWYAAVLGLAPTLKQFIVRNPALVKDQNLLVAAVETPYSDSLKILLTHGADPNTYVSTSHAEGPLIVLAANCRRPTNMLYLIQSGADIYESYGSGKANAMAVSLTGDSVEGPFKKGVALLLAAGYDPRCPVAKDSTALTVAERGLPSPEVISETLNARSPDGLLRTKKQKQDFRSYMKAFRTSLKRREEVIAMLKGALAIVRARSSGSPSCRFNSSVPTK